MRKLTLILTLTLTCLAGPAAAEMDDSPAPENRPPRLSELARPRVSTPSAEPEAPKIRVGRQLIRHANPVALGRTVAGGYRNREFLSTHGTVHHNPARAMVHSMAPLRTGANTRAAVKGAFDPASLALTAGFPVAQEAVRQFVHDGRIDGSELRENLHVGALAGSFGGGLAGSVAGAAVQSALASSLGPAGTVAGFVARPMMAWVGGVVGARIGDDASHGKLSLKDAFRQSFAQVQPGRDIGAVVGGTAGMVIGQALIPIPGVGGFVGSMAGTMVGGWVGSKLFPHKNEKDPTGAVVQQGVKGLLGKTRVVRASAGGFSPIAGLAASGN